MDNDKLEKKEIILNNLCIAIHLSLKYLMNNKKKKNNYKFIINSIVPDFYPKKKETDEEEEEDNMPFVIDDNNKELISKWSNLSIKSNDLNEAENKLADLNKAENKLAFIKPFNKLLEHIHIFIAINYPLIIEGLKEKNKLLII